MGLRDIRVSILAKANGEDDFCLPPSKDGGNAVNRNAALDHSIEGKSLINNEYFIHSINTNPLNINAILTHSKIAHSKITHQFIKIAYDHISLTRNVALAHSHYEFTHAHLTNPLNRNAALAHSKPIQSHNWL